MIKRAVIISILAAIVISANFLFTDNDNQQGRITKSIFSNPFGKTYTQVMLNSDTPVSIILGAILPVSSDFLKKDIYFGGGDASYHFVKEDNVFINWKHFKNDTFENGFSLPETKRFTNISFDPETRTFFGELDFSPDSVEGATLWKYGMIFSEGYQQIIDGEFSAFNEKGEEVNMRYFDKNSWFYLVKQSTEE